MRTGWTSPSEQYMNSDLSLRGYLDALSYLQGQGVPTGFNTGKGNILYPVPNAVQSLKNLTESFNFRCIILLKHELAFSCNLHKFGRHFVMHPFLDTNAIMLSIERTGDAITHRLRHGSRTDHRSVCTKEMSID